MDVHRIHSIKEGAGKFAHEAVWRYLFTHPVDSVGQPVPADPLCKKDLREPAGKKK